MARESGAAVARSERDAWTHARLIPTLGNRDQLERERRATSCLLAVMHGVPEFGHALLKELGAPKSPVIETFTEVRFKDAEGKLVTPDGAIVCERGRKSWTCLVEVKTGNDKLGANQVSEYLTVAREKGFDAVLTISPEITASSDESPLEVSKRKLRRVHLYHFSWWRILTEAVVQQRYRGVSDPDQEWVLKELIHYLSSEASGALGFEDMGKSWVAVRSAARNETLRSSDPGVREIAERWEQFTCALALGLAQELGADVRPHRPRGQSTAGRLEQNIKDLAERGALSARLDIPNAIGPLDIRADLRSQQTLTSVSFDGPKSGTPRGRFGWLLRQLKDAPDDLLIEAAFPNVRTTTATSLGELRQDGRALNYPPEPKRPPRAFVLTRARVMGRKRGRAEGSFVNETGAQAIGFYEELIENLRPWQAPAPKTHSSKTEIVEGLPPTPTDEKSASDKAAQAAGRISEKGRRDDESSDSSDAE